MVIGEKDLKFIGLTEREIETLKLFHQQIEKINKSRIIETSSLKYSYHIEVNEKGIKAKDANLPDEDDLRSLLLLISPLVRTKERIHYTEILSILKKRSKNDETRSYFDLLEETYNTSLSSGLRYGANGNEYTDKDIFRLLLNGCYFHSDDGKRNKLNDLGGIPYATEGALLGTLCVHVSWLRFIDRIIADRIFALNESS